MESDNSSSPTAEHVAAALRTMLHNYDSATRSLGRRLELGANDVASLQYLMGAHDVGPADLAKHLGITSASATALIDRLEDAGYVQRGPHPTDRRRRIITLTSFAPERVLGALAPLMAAEAKVCASYDADQRAVVKDLLDRISELYGEFGAA